MIIIKFRSRTFRCFWTFRSDLPGVNSKRCAKGTIRGYLHGKKGIHRGVADVAATGCEVYLGQAERDDRFRVVDCAGDDGTMLPPPQIFERIRAALAGVFGN